MNPFNTSFALSLGAIMLFSISSVNASGCSSHVEKKVDIECLSDDKKCIDAKEKDLLLKFEA